MNHSTARRQWVERLVDWAKLREDVRAVILVGSMGRVDHHPADEWSDVDLLFITSKPDAYTTNNAWMKEIGPFWAGVLPPGETFGGLLPVYCGFSTYEGGVVVEYFILSSARAKWALPLIRFLNRFPSLRRWLPETVAALGAEVRDLLQNGAQIPLDKDGLAERLRDITLSIPATPQGPPSPREFQNSVDDFWIGPPKIAADLRRGHLISTMKTLETTRRGLLKMIEWHARAKHGWDGNDMAYRPTRIEAWADPRAKEVLPRLYACYNAEEIWQVLFAMMELYSMLTTETAVALGYPYLSEAEQIISWVEDCFSDYSQIAGRTRIDRGQIPL